MPDIPPDAELKVRITIVNVNQDCRTYEDVEDTDCETAGEIYRRARREYGRCTGKVYLEPNEGPVRPVGWVFQKRVKYSDCDEYYLQEAWVCPVRVTKPSLYSVEV